MGIVVFHRSSHERHRDPKGNRPELPTDTSWYEDQSCRFEIDFALPDAALIEFTRQQIKELPGYREVSAWRRQQLEAIQQGLVN